MSRTIGGGHFGPDLKITCVPDSTFKSEIDTLIATNPETAATKLSGAKLVSLTFLNNYEVTSPANDARFDGFVTDYSPIVPSPYYYLTVDLVRYSDQNGNRWTARRILHLPYSGTIALQDSVIINGTTYYLVDDGGTGGDGAVISKDTPTGYVDVLF